MKILISDKADPICAKILRDNNLEVDEITGQTPEELAKTITDYAGLIVRSATKVTKEILDAGVNLKIIGRAGAGVDNIDVPYASEKKIIVENTPGANTNGVVELALTYIFALSRDIFSASASMKDGKWEKKKFMGVEAENKTLGILGYGKIGKQVAKKSIGLGMSIIAFDPFIPGGKTDEYGVQLLNSFDELLEQSDLLTLHLPLNDKTRDLFTRETFAKMKKGAFLINCARGGIVNEEALLWALNEGIISMAGIDVFEKEPTDNFDLVNHSKVICTPHLGASTKESQKNTAVMIANQFVEYFKNNKVIHQVNKF